jgi:GTP:adenosylcobinamide-phosphate guanylyltransferase
MSHTAVVLAGSRPGGDEFARGFGTDLKALIPVAGEPMVRRPVRALLESDCIERVLVLSQAPERLGGAVAADPRVSIRKSAATIARTILDLLDDPDIRWPLLVTTADHALLEPDMVGEMVRGSHGADIGIGVVDKASLLSRLPSTRRTWLNFRRGSYTGANLFTLSSPRVRPAIELWRSVEQDRKKAWRVMSLVGPFILAAVALRLVTLDEVMSQLSGRLALDVRAVRLSSPLAGVDVDKPADHLLVEAILAGRA